MSDAGRVSSPVIEAVSEVVRYRMDLSPRQANDLYNEVYALLRDKGMMSAGDRDPGFIPALCAIYDALYAAGVDGSS